MRCAFGVHLDVGLAERPTPCRFVGNFTFPSLFLGKMAVFDKTESLPTLVGGHHFEGAIRSGEDREICLFGLISPRIQASSKTL